MGLSWSKKAKYNIDFFHLVKRKDRSKSEKNNIKHILHLLFSSVFFFFSTLLETPATLYTTLFFIIFLCVLCLLSLANKTRRLLLVFFLLRSFFFVVFFFGYENITHSYDSSLFGRRSICLYVLLWISVSVGVIYNRMCRSISKDAKMFNHHSILILTWSTKICFNFEEEIGRFL